ncbi:MAG TPA: class I SAM-dependent methyltransferase, partial [Candidatus Nitrosocosmicus sp.]|nr:class I SAM-dependent methyltransferase [Candidatus Nitrosocosmicus sp.]
MGENFSDYLTDILNKGSLSLMLSIGHRTKLFDIMSSMSPATFEEIAARSGLNSRYVKEWLGAMVTGKIVNYDPIKKSFHLSKEKAQYLTSQNSVYDFSASMQWIPILAQVEDDIVKCFRFGGGVPYSSYKRFHEVMAEESYQTVVAGLLEHIIPLVSGLDAQLQSGISVLDVGCGRGRAINLLAKHYRKSKFTGYDLSDEAIKDAALDAESMNNDNAKFMVQNLLTLEPSAKFDLITAFDVIHDQINPQRTLKFIFDSLEDQGIF